jgi:RimJ/RimL family protein N-acetyltransferase
MPVPVLETPRLRLRGGILEDFPFVRDTWSDERVTRHISGEPQPEEVSWSKFLRKIGHWELLGFGYWTIELSDTGTLVGETGFGEFKRDLQPSIRGEPEIGWVIAPAFQGRGLAYEAARAAVDWGDANLASERMSCIIDPANAPSIRVAEKLGFERTHTTQYQGTDTAVFHRAIRRA